MSLVLLGAALAGIGAWRLTARSASAPTPAEPAVAGRGESLADVQRIVAERNRAAGKDEDAFRADGWGMVAADPPEPRVTSFDPALLAGGREQELRHQLVTTVPAPRDVRNVARIALEAKDVPTRFAAVDALAHMGSDEAQIELVDLLTGGKLDSDDLVRRQIAPLLRPRDLDDPIALRMAALLDDPRLTAVERRQIAFTLGLVSIRDGMTLPEATLASLSPDAHARLDEARGLATQRIALHARPNEEKATSAITDAPILTLPTWWWSLFFTYKCQKWDGSGCTSADMANPYYKQILILPAGFEESERTDFWNDFDKIRDQMANAGNVWSTQYRHKLLWIGYFVPGGQLGTDTTNFDAKVLPHPVRGYALSLTQDKVRDRVSSIRQATLPALNPMGVGVLFNSFQDGITANASPPSFTRTAYGIAKFNREDLKSSYITTHELAHAAMNLLDEYMEPGFEDLSIRQLDLLTPLVLFDGSWGGFVSAISDLLSVYDYNISEILANNGNVNIALSPWPQTTGSGGQWFGYEGGMFFGRGTFHVPGNNLMDSNRSKRHPDDGFAYDTTSAQQQIIDSAFNGNWAYRANDRLRNAGPRNGWPLSLGSTTTVMLFDGDKNNQFHPTRHYGVQVGWYERIWETCWYGPFPYPCYHDDWRTAEKTVWASVRYVDLQNTAAYGLAGMVQDVLCAVGVTEVKNGGGTFKLCEQDLDQISGGFLPTLRFFMPYQNTTVPASQWFTTYWWRFYSFNGTWNSYYTGWSSFYRSF